MRTGCMSCHGIYMSLKGVTISSLGGLFTYDIDMLYMEPYMDMWSLISLNISASAQGLSV